MQRGHVKSYLWILISGNSSEVLPLRGSEICHLLQQRASCTSATSTVTNSSAKMDMDINETFPAVKLASCRIIHPVRDHPSRLLQSTSLLGFQGGNRKNQGTQTCFSLCDWNNRYMFIFLRKNSNLDEKMGCYFFFFQITEMQYWERWWETEENGIFYHRMSNKVF